MNRQRRIGQWGEQVAAEFLEAQGYTILKRNLRTPYGEVDLVVQSGNWIVFVEVKARTSRTHGFPEESITPRKKEHFLNAVTYAMEEHQEWEGNWRVDVIAIEGTPERGEPRVVWFENAFA